VICGLQTLSGEQVRPQIASNGSNQGPFRPER
jgi:hypothetical protein